MKKVQDNLLGGLTDDDITLFKDALVIEQKDVEMFKNALATIGTMEKKMRGMSVEARRVKIHTACNGQELYLKGISNGCAIMLDLGTNIRGLYATDTDRKGVYETLNTKFGISIKENDGGVTMMVFASVFSDFMQLAITHRGHSRFAGEDFTSDLPTKYHFMGSLSSIYHPNEDKLEDGSNDHIVFRACYSYAYYQFVYDYIQKASSVTGKKTTEEFKFLDSIYNLEFALEAWDRQTRQNWHSGKYTDFRLSTYKRNTHKMSTEFKEKLIKVFKEGLSKNLGTNTVFKAIVRDVRTDMNLSQTIIDLAK